MYRYKNGSIRMELSQESREKGYTMRANVNPDYIGALKRCNREAAAIISVCIKLGQCQRAIRMMQDVKNNNQRIREVSEKHDKLVRDANGEVIYWWDEAEKRMYTVE